MTYSLGLDIGARSIGWAAIASEGERPAKILGMGVRVFEAGMEGAVELGREESRGAARRQARLARRQTRRRRQRSRTLYRTLAEAGLLPAATHEKGKALAVDIQRTLNELDRQLREKYAGDPRVQRLPYLLRARALDEALDPFELGRALYHLGQRRGFLSNRKARAKGDEERGAVYAGIHKLEEKLAGCRTLGEHLAGLDPAVERIRRRYTHRSMFEHELSAIWEAQARHRPELTEELRAKVESVMFFQRPLKDADDLVGACEWDPQEKRAPLWSLEFQRFRVLQNAAHVRVQEPDGAVKPLTQQQRARLIEKLETVRDLSVTKAKDLLGIPRNHRFTFEEGKETKFRGNAVAAQMNEVLGGFWAGLDEQRRMQFLDGIAATRTDEELCSLLADVWGFSAEAARDAAERISLPAGYAPLSRKSMQAALPFLEAGMSVQEARQAAGFEVLKTVPVHDVLPPLAQTGIDIRNPAVLRSLTELRKVVNAVVKKWGKPDEIHIEMARDLKKSREARQHETTLMRERENERARMLERLVNELHIPKESVRPRDIEVGLLYEECNGICPYTGEPLGSFTSLYGGNARAQVEHIIPRSVSLEDGFENLTLARVEANAEKNNRTPFEAYGHDETRFGQMIERVQAFKGKYRNRKLERFRMAEADKEKLLEKFSERHLNDTRYATRSAADYVSLLFGGEVVGGRRKIIKATGQITADLRGVWNLNAILGDGPRKSRDDHRHHAIDAAVLAVVGPRHVQLLSEAAERAWQEKKRRYGSVEPPWAGFREDVERAVGQINVSFRPDHRVSGGLHKDTLYTAPMKNARGGDMVRTRKPVHLLKTTEVEKIVDPAVREAVKAKLNEVGEAKKLEGNFPLLPNKNGAPVPIKSVRIELNRDVNQIGHGHKARYAEGSETHHVAVCEVSEKGKRVWRGEVVPKSEALRRLREKRPVVDRSEHDGRGFLFSLAKNDTVELNDPSGKWCGVWVVKKLYKQVLMVPQHDARPESKRTEFAPTVGGLQKLGARKVVISPLGEAQASRE